MIILLEDTWEAEDIKIYFSNFKEYNVIELSVDELFKYDSNEFFKTIYFCNTDIVQFHLNKLNKTNLIPDTYDKIFNKFYLREIKISKFKNIKSGNFIKPINNNKLFDGQIYIDDDKFIGTLPSPESLVYESNKITFLCEYRLLIGNNKLYGFGFIQGLYPNIKSSSINIINDIINITNERYLCIDIGYIKEYNKWGIVEINPPFSLDDHKILLDDYMSFCIDSCKYINNLVNN